MTRLHGSRGLIIWVPSLKFAKGSGTSRDWQTIWATPSVGPIVSPHPRTLNIKETKCPKNSELGRPRILYKFHQYSLVGRLLLLADMGFLWWDYVRGHLGQPWHADLRDPNCLHKQKPIHPRSSPDSNPTSATTPMATSLILKYHLVVF